MSQAIEHLLDLGQLQDALAKVLPTDTAGNEQRPARRTLYGWMEAKKYPMPCIQRPCTGQGTGKRTGRWFRLSDVLAWLEDPVAYYANKAKAS